MNRFVVQTATRELDLTPLVISLSVKKSISLPVTQVFVSLRFDREYVTTDEIASCKKAIVEWELQTLTKEDVITLELQIVGFEPTDAGVLGSYGGEPQTTPVLSTLGLHAIPYTSLFLWKAYEAFYDSVSSESLIREICGGNLKRLDPPQISTLRSVYLPTMNRLQALSTVVRRYNVYNQLVFFVADLDGSYLIDSTRSMNDPVKELYYLPDLTDFSRYAGKSFAQMVHVLHSYAQSSMKVPQTLACVDLTHDQLYLQNEFPFTQLSTLGGFKHLFDTFDKKRVFGGSSVKASMSSELFSSLMLHVSCSYIDPVGLVPGMCVEFKSEDTRFAHLSGRYLVLEFSGTYAFQTVHKQSTTIVLGRCGI